MRQRTAIGIVLGAALTMGAAWAPTVAGRAAGQVGTPRPKITGVAGIAIKTRDLDAAKRFYGTILGLDEAFPVKNPTAGRTSRRSRSTRSSTSTLRPI
jgi:hypothetical protein